MDRPSFVKKDFDFNRLFFLFIRCTLSLIMGAMTYLQVVKLYVNEAYTKELILFVVMFSLLFGILFILADYMLWILVIPTGIMLASILLNFKAFIATVKDIYNGLVSLNNVYMNRVADVVEPTASVWGFIALFLVICFYVVMVSYLGCAPILGTMPFWFLIVAGCLTDTFPDLWIVVLIAIVTALNIILNAHHGKGLNLSALSSGSIIAVVCAVLVCCVFLTPFFNHAEEYSQVLRDWQDRLTANLKNGDINDALASLTEDPSKVKLVNEPTDDSEDVQLEVTVSENQPYGKIYLKGFAGAKYSGNSWTATGNSEFEKYGNKVEVSSSTLLSENYYFLESVNAQKPELNLLETMFEVSHVGDDKAYRYTPENPLITDEDADYAISDAYLLRNNEESYSFTAYQADDLRNLGPTITDNPLTDWAEEQYTDTGGLEDNDDFVALMSNGEGLDLQGTIDFVKDTLKNYTYSNDFDPINESEDFVENFLFYQKYGNCQHFATAGTLMFRYLGIPARYVTGYCYDISDSNNSLQNGVDSTWSFSVRQYHAHAWVEIFVADYGWITVDVTPGSNAEEYFEAKSSESNDSEEAEATPTPEPDEDYEPTPQPDEDEPEPSPTPEDLDIDNENESTPPPEDNNNDNNDNQDNSGILKTIFTVLIILLIIALLVLIYLLIKRKKDKARFTVTEKHDLDEILSENLGLIERCIGGRLNETDRTYLTRILKDVLDSDKLEKYITACEEAAFSNTGFTDEETAVITDICRTCRTSSLAKLKKGKRFLYVYILMK